MHLQGEAGTFYTAGFFFAIRSHDQQFGNDDKLFLSNSDISSQTQAHAHA